MLTIISSMIQPTQGLRIVSMVRKKSTIALIEPSLPSALRPVGTAEVRKMLAPLIGVLMKWTDSRQLIKLRKKASS